MSRTPSFQLDPAAGGRLAQLSVGGYDLLFSPPDPTLKPTSWGAYPMVPFAGRIDRGRFAFGGAEHDLPINHGEHAIHGTTLGQAWTEIAPGHLAVDLDQPWPFAGTVSHRVHLERDSELAGRLILELSVLAGGRSMPVMVGWHPWFRRRLTPTGPAAELEFSDFESMEMYTLDDRSIPTGQLESPPPPGPWDHPFRSVAQPITLRWDGQVSLALRSDCDHWVIFDQKSHALCVEPQSGPPDVFNSDRFDLQPDVLEPGEQFTRTFTIDWSLP